MGVISKGVRFPVFLLLAGLLTGISLAQEKVVQTFEGVNGLTTPAFQVQDKWEVRWDCPDVLSVTLLAPDGTIVAGSSGAVKGSLYLPKGGSFTLQLNRAAGATTSWHVSVVEIGASAASTATTDYVPPSTAPVPVSSTAVSNPTTTNAAPVASSIPAPPSAPATNSAPTIAPAGGLTGDQAHAVVVIKGDLGEGTGFLVRTADGPAVVTNIHVIFANPNVKIFTTTGAQIQTTGLKGASDRDLAMISIQDNHYTYLDLATDIKDTVQAGDEVITPGNSEGGEVVLDTQGTVLGIGPQQVEFSNPIYHGNSGGPVFHTKSGKVLAVVTKALKVDTSSDIDKASFENKDSAISGTMRYFGLRLDTVPQWEPYDWNRFLTETTFLKNFHDQSRGLDSFMNGVVYERAHLVSTDEYGHPDSQYFLRNDKIVAVRDNYHKMTVDTDSSQKLDAARELSMDLEGIADTDMDAIQNPVNFYSFDQLRAADEIKYRKALRNEIEKFSGSISDMGH
jgi:S1-C subfamily serine protease